MDSRRTSAGGASLAARLDTLGLDASGRRGQVEISILSSVSASPITMVSERACIQVTRRAVSDGT
jgi:hypothetical protein